jgi:hypothetical protein
VKNSIETVARWRRLTDAFHGKTVKEVDATCINTVHFHFTDGTSATIDCDETFLGIGVIQLTTDPN